MKELSISEETSEIRSVIHGILSNAEEYRRSESQKQLVLRQAYFEKFKELLTESYISEVVLKPHSRVFVRVIRDGCTVRPIVPTLS